MKKLNYVSLPYSYTLKNLLGVKYFADGNDSGGSDESKNTGDSGGNSNTSNSGANKNTITIDDIPKEVFSEVFNKGFKKADAKNKNALDQKLAEMGVTDEKLKEWKQLEEDKKSEEQKKMEQKGEFEKLKQQMVDQHNEEVVKLNKTIDSKDGTIHKLVVRNKLIAHASNECVDPSEVADLLEPKFKAEEINGEWLAVPYENETKLVDKDGNPQSVKSYLEKWLENKPHHKKSNIGQGGTGSRTNQSYKRGESQTKKGWSPQQSIKSGLRSKNSPIYNSRDKVAVDEK